LNPNFRSSLRANVGLVSIERQGGGLDGGATFQSGNTQDRNSIHRFLQILFGKISLYHRIRESKPTTQLP
jgi:hypothetical protein